MAIGDQNTSVIAPFEIQQPVQIAAAVIIQIVKQICDAVAVTKAFIKSNFVRAHDDANIGRGSVLKPFVDDFAFGAVLIPGPGQGGVPDNRYLFC